MAITLSCLGVASAVSIGEIVSQSKLGEPLSIRVELGSAPGEKIENACLSLQAPDPDEEGAQNYLVSANLAIAQEIGRQFVVISSRKPYNEAFGKISLRVNCRGQGSVAKTLIFLPDLDVTPPPEITAPAITAGAEGQVPADIAPSLSQATIQKWPREQLAVQPEDTHLPSAARKNLYAKPRTGAPPRSARPIRKKGRSEIFMFKLSSDPIDESRIGKISLEERELLLAKQKLLDADDQMAGFLAMQHQIKQLQDELGEIKLKLSQFSAGQPAANADGSRQSASNANAKEKKLEFFAGGLVLAILILLLGLRYYNKVRIRRLGEEVWKSSQVEPETAEMSAPLAQSATPKIGYGSFKKPKPAALHTAKNGRVITSTPLSSSPISQEELSEADSIIEEAELYSTYGHPERAILMLQELIRQQPGKGEAWELLLFTLSSQNKIAEFEKTAREFIPFNKSSDAWKKIQALGRVLERNNPLYADDSAGKFVSPPPSEHPPEKRHLIGNILVESGALSVEDMKNYLDDFDPKQDGRIGDFLVSRKAITNEQLIDALRMQQSAATAASLQPDTNKPHDVDDFIPDIDRKQDERLDEYLKMDMSRSKNPKKT